MADANHTTVPTESAASTSRRGALSVFFAAAAAASPALAIAAPSAAGRTAAAYRAYTERLAHLESHIGDFGGDDDLAAAAWSDVFNMEAAILNSPIVSADDAAAKLRVVGLSLDRGDRADGADVRGLAHVVAWLERAS